MHGVLVVDKPRGPTSHDIVRSLRKALGTSEIGHAGTLDPMATGVLVVVVGEATKLSAHLTEQDKAYDATLRLGIATDTLDAEGTLTADGPVDGALLAALEAAARGEIDAAIATALDAERSRTAQVPPAFSAISTGGVRSHERARKGEDVVHAPREVTVHALAVTGATREPPALSLHVEASKGYYVRSLAQDLAAALGTVGHLTALRRTRSGVFALGEAVTPDAPPEVLVASLLPLAAAAARVFPVVHLTPEGVVHARQGRALPPEEHDGRDLGLAAWLDTDGRLVALGSVDAAGIGRVTRGFAPASEE